MAADISSARTTSSASTTWSVNASRSSHARPTDIRTLARVATTPVSAGAGSARSGRARNNAPRVSSSWARR